MSIEHLVQITGDAVTQVGVDIISTSLGRLRNYSFLSLLRPSGLRATCWVGMERERLMQRGVRRIGRSSAFRHWACQARSEERRAYCGRVSDQRAACPLCLEQSSALIGSTTLHCKEMSVQKA